MGYGLNTGAQSARREIMLNGRRITTVDVHAHCVFPEVAEVIAGSPLDGRRVYEPDPVEPEVGAGVAPQCGADVADGAVNAGFQDDCGF